MTTYTQAQIALEVLNLLDVVGTQQSAETEDITAVTNKIPAVIDELAARNVIQITDADAVEAEFFNPLCEIVANECAPTFGKPKNEALREAAEERLRIMVRAAPSYPLRIESALLNPRRYGYRL